jgi:hypothetical protein
MKLLFAVYDTGVSKLEVTVEDENGHRRRVTVVHHAIGITIPDNWLDQVKGEVDYQIESEKDTRFIYRG